MNDFDQRIARLSPEKRALLVQRLAPLSFGQQRIWMLEQSQPGSLFYKTEVSLHLNGALNIGVLVQSLTEVFRRHESLRTVFPIINGQAVQLVTPAQPVHLPVTDLSHLPVDTQETETQSLINSLNREVFDLERGPLWRMQLVKLSAEEHVMVLVVHHLVFDGWSRGVLTREMGVLYNAYLKGEASPLPELPMQYGAYARWQHQTLSGEMLDEQKRYWREQLEGELPELELPGDHPRPAITSHRGAVQTLEISAGLAQQVKALSRREGVTVFMTLLAAFQALIYCYTRESDFIVGTPVSGRHRAGTPALVGCFVNIITVRTRLKGSPTFRELLAQTRKLSVEALAHQDLPFAELLENLWPGQPLGSYGIRNGRKLFRVMLDYSLVPARKLGPTPSSSSLQISVPEVGETLTGLDFYIAVAESEDGLFGTVTCTRDLFDEDTITGMRKDFERVLLRCVENPDGEILNIPVSITRTFQTLPLGQPVLGNQIEGGQQL
jgi:Condensation domain